MANTPKKPAGLGRGLGELLDDNTPDLREDRGSVTMKNEGGSIRITPIGSTEIKPKTLFETQHKNRSVKANFKK
ncbi:MAG: hypothetical protein E7642_06845 [Ruminococcaceae bacterium]|nr:hypothetical protein [Oscillospiraceae bacterium]